MVITYDQPTLRNMINSLDRKNHKLPEETIKILYSIKKKLNIKELNNAKQYEYFEKPKIKSEDDILNNIYKCLNKITEKTYDKISNDILKIMDDLALEDETKNKAICNKFFEIVSNNSICGDVYAKLYHDISNKHEVFIPIFKRQIQIYIDQFKTLMYVSPNENYDAYCDYVKQLDKMKNFTLFLTKSLQYLICSLDDIVDILLYFQTRCITTIEDVVFIIENEQVADSMYLIIRDVIDSLIFHDSWEFIKKNIIYLHEYKGPGKSNKMKFKIMDIQDIIRKNEE